MINIAMHNNNYKVKKLLFRCLKSAGFEVTNIDENLVTIELAKYNYANNPHNSKYSNHKKIFPLIPRLRTVFDFIELNYHQNIKLKEVAQTVGYSSAYLTDLVKRMTGRTVNEWIIERRIAQAKYLLLETDKSIESIAFEIGYQNLNHFYRQFRNYCCKTPRSWRKEQRC